MIRDSIAGHVGVVNRLLAAGTKVEKKDQVLGIRECCSGRIERASAYSNEVCWCWGVVVGAQRMHLSDVGRGWVREVRFSVGAGVTATHPQQQGIRS